MAFCSKKELLIKYGYKDTRLDHETMGTSREMIAEVIKFGGQPLHTEYPGVGNNVFMWVYTEPGLVEWIFAQHR